MIKKLLYSFLIIFHISLFAQEDCVSAIMVCGNSEINYTPVGIGNNNEALGGCLFSGEHHSVWYKFTIATSGTLTFNLVPTGPVDYDWAIYGPNASCSNLGNPIRCNASGALTSTGMNMTNTNTSSGSGPTDPYCKYMDVVAGQTYYLYLDNWSTTVFTFNLTWGGSATFVSPFTDATLAPNPFIAPGNPGTNINSPRVISICNNGSFFDFNTLTPGILNGNTNFTVSYFDSVNDALTGNNPISGPLNINTSNIYYYNINYHDPNNPANIINSCKQTKAIVFKNNGLTASITTPTTILCHNGSVVLTASNPTGNTWSTGATTQSITVTTPGTYTLSSNNGFCTSPQASVTITQETDPNIQITGNTVLCESVTQLIASANGAGNIYTWSNGFIGNTISITTPGTYTVTVKTIGNCLYQKTVVVTQGVVPVVHNTSLNLCSDSDSATFDLTTAEADISSTAGIDFTYYQNLSDAIAGNTNTVVAPTAFTSGNATVYVRVRSVSCSKISELQLIVNQKPVPVITASSNIICSNNPITLTSNFPTGNVWSTGQTAQNITVTSAGTYTLINNDGNCASNAVAVTITQEADPNIQITGNTVLCEPVTQLIASANGAGNIYTWSNGFIGNTISITTPGTYTVTVKTAGNCLYHKTVVVTQGVVPVVHNTSLNLCSDSDSATFDLTTAEADISSTAGIDFTYYQNLSDAIAGNTNTVVAPTAFTSGNATVYVRVRSVSCSKISELQLIVNQKPVPVITASSNIICSNNPITLTSNFPTGNVWSTGQTAQNITVTSAGTYTLINNNGNCASNAVAVTINQEADPDVQIIGNLAFCEGSFTTITATSTVTGSSFLWSNGISTATNIITVPGLYTVTVTTPSGCQFQKSVTLVMDPTIVISITTPEQITCINSQVSLNAMASVYQPGATFLWVATGGGNIVSGANTLNAIVNEGGTYSLTIRNPTLLGCAQQSSVMVTKNVASPNIFLNASKGTICKGESIVLTASGAISYTWAGLTGNGNTQTVSPGSTTTYTITGSDVNGCVALTPATITINVVPEITSTLHNVEICKGEKAILDAGEGVNYTYSWNTGATTQTISTELDGTYTVTINNGICSKTFTAVVSYILTPEILEVNYKNGALSINAKNNGNTSLEYSIDGGLSWQSSAIFTNVLRNTQYSIRVRNKWAICYSEIGYYTLFLSNVITPNGDGKNDIIDFSEIRKKGNFEGNIFDKYGKVVFKISFKTPIWDGKLLGQPLPTDTYWYRLFWEDQLSKKRIDHSGWILLKNRN